MAASLRRAFVPFIAVLAIWVVAGTAVAYADSHNVAVGNEIRDIIEGGQTTVGIDDADQRLIQVFTYYAERDYKPLWVRDNGPKSKARDLLTILKTSYEDGLDPQDYEVAEISERIDGRTPRQLAELDLLLTRAFIDYGRDLSTGQVEPDKLGGPIHITPIGPGPLTLLDGAEQADDIPEYVDTRIAPQSANYARLKQALAVYRQIAERGGWPRMPDGPVLKPGMADARIPVLARYLAVTGDLRPELAQSAGADGTYDDTLVAAVKRFQERHGLAVDGVIGAATLEQINVPVDRRIHQMVLNLERRRWMPEDLGSFYVFVNLADQYLKVVDGEQTVHDAPLVVGKPYHQSPVFSDNMTYIVFNPYWNVPYSIAVNEYLPKLRANPGALQSQNIRVLTGKGAVNPYAINWSAYSRRKFPFRLRQDPGPKNALGRIKFMFPNPYNVYIHDTPAKSLFSRATRTFSHGCMRVQDPVKLADILLGHDDPHWTPERVKAEFARGDNRVVRLKTPIPVHVTYLTAWANKDGSINFRKDVYDRDPRLTAALDRSQIAMQ
ncbi:L,D-transpeptidase family protein [Kaustia mangrovi]|uniref:L,D-transpeptidase family protein n=1 Tax=Kaustia mangrovi TaxID=2593653 RepID=A0A7S8C6T8_9HYPH|nr:L,D-transpeptidase family protein [Kaustia mangrovi]QPC44269.1 L,D-transpeptidase family protein [Kaustia mangrovi]